MGTRRVISVLRGQIWLVDVGLDEPKRFIIVSNNQRNRFLNDVLGARVTTSKKPELPSVAEFGPKELGPARSFVVADDILPLQKVDLVRQVGALSISQMSKVEGALKAAFYVCRKAQLS